MKVSINKNKRLIPLFIVFVLLFQFIISTISSIKFTEDVHAEALSPKDTLLLKVLKAGFKKCIEGGVLTQNNIKDSKIDRNILFNVTSPIFGNDKNVRLPFKYGSGNKIDDGDISCEQLFEGYGDSDGKNSFSTFSVLGGKIRPNYYAAVAERNSLIEALGYTASNRGNAQLYCAALNYTVTEAGGTGSTRTTNSICVNIVDGKIKPSQGEKITANDVTVKNTTSDKYVRLGFDGYNKKVYVSMDLSELPEKNNCKYGSKPVYDSPSLDKYIGKKPEEFFSDMFNEIESSQSLNKAKASGFSTKGNGWPCIGDTFPEAIGAKSVVTNSTGSVNTGSDEKAVSGTDLNNSLAKDYTYGGSPNYDNLMKYYLPSYPVPSAGAARGSLDYELYGGSSAATQTGGFTAVERAYNWYYEFNDIFNAISADTSIGCSTSRPSNGAYLQYFKKSESDPNKTEIQYCPMNESVLNLKANEALMKHETNGKGVVNAADPISDTIKPQTAREILNNLNSINLASVCAADSNFPLCQATPIECKEDPNKDGCKELAGNNASEEEDGAKGEMSACFQNAGALGWMICPLMYTLRDAVQGIFNEFVEPLIRVDKSIVTNLAQNNDSSAMYKAWSLFRNMANIIFVIALLFVIFSQVTGFGIDNYGIKRLLPKLIVTAIIVNFSYFICGIVVDLSNLIGNSVRDIFENASRDPTFTAGTGSDGLGAFGVATGVATGVAAAVTSVVALVTAGSALSAAATSGGLLALILPVLGLAASAFMAGFFALLMLGARQAIIIIMIVTSPIAFVLYALPNTNALFKKWVSLFRGLLLLYPIYCFMVGGGFMAAKLIVKDSTGVFIQLIAGFISIAPYFAVPSMTRNALKGFDAAVNGIAKLQNRVNGGMQFAGKKVMNSETVKASAGNYEFGKQAKFAKKYDGYTQEQLAQLSPSKRRRLMNALGTIGKDAQQAATIGAAMSQFKFNTSNEGKARAGAMAMTAEDENQVKAHQSDLIDKNMSYDEALKNLIDLQNEGYGENEEENHQRDLKMRAYQRHILSTKDGQKAYERYLKKGRYEDDDGNIIKSGSTSERSRAVLARDYMSNNSGLKDKYGVTYQQMQSMQGSGSVNTLRTSADGSAAIKNARTNAVDKFVKTMDSKDIREISKYDAEEVDKAIEGGVVTQETKDKLEGVARDAARVLENDPTQVGELNDAARNLISNRSGIDLNNLGNRVMEVRDNNGQLIQTMRWAKNDPINGNGNGGGNGNGNGGGNGGNGNGSGNGGPTP